MPSLVELHRHRQPKPPAHQWIHVLLILTLLYIAPAADAFGTPKICRLVRSRNLLLGSGSSSPGNTPSPSVSSEGDADSDPWSSSKPSSSPSPSATSSPLPPDEGEEEESGEDEDQWSAFEYGQVPVRGVNLGGWFVLEPWITPSFFEQTGDPDIIDEYTLGQRMDRSEALSRLQQHWNSWYQEDDFRQMKSVGLNHVRIPLGYWSVPLTPQDTEHTLSVDPYIPGAWPYFLEALNWARKHQLHVIVDIHGAPGSQNGYDNSGQRTSSPQWALDPVNIARTLDAIRFIVKNAGGLISMMELLNEGAGFRGQEWEDALRQFFQDGYEVVREEVGEGMKVMIGDGFLTVDRWTGYLALPDAQGVFMDIHQYQIFSNLELERSFDQHISHACSHIPSLTTYAFSNLWTIMGEWSLATTDCARWLNGRNIGSRWDGTYPNSLSALGSCAGYTGNSANWTEEYKSFLRRYFESQISIGESVQGWVFWTWKAEEADEWSYQKGVEGGWIPRDLEERVFGDVCG